MCNSSPIGTRINQHLDFGLFGCLKTSLKSRMAQWARQPEHKGKCFHIVNFAKMIKDVNDDVATSEVIKNSFRKCGIFPWNIENVDFSRCLSKNIFVLNFSLVPNENQIHLWLWWASGSECYVCSLFLIREPDDWWNFTLAVDASLKNLSSVLIQFNRCCFRQKFVKAALLMNFLYFIYIYELFIYVLMIR